MTKTHLLIPARLQSSRLPTKPLLTIHGEPMILWTARRAKVALKAGVADDYVVATDDERICQLCQQHKVPVVMTDSHHASGTDRLAQVALQLGYAPDDIVINLQGDEPLMPVILLQQVKNLLINQPGCAMATLCEPIANLDEFVSPSVVKVVIANEQALYFSRSPIPHHRSCPDDYSVAYRHLGLYAYRVHLLQVFATWQVGVLESLESLEQLRILEHGQKIAIAQALTSLPLGVDTPADLDRLNAMPLEALMAYL